MAGKLDENIKAILKGAGLGSDAVWLHKQSGKYIMYHWACERAAAHKGILFDPPQMICADAEKKIATICVTGRLGDVSEWSFGEAAPYNTTQTYPFAMAEKRAKDRVILKLIGLHGFAYSEEEADDFKASAPGPMGAIVEAANADAKARQANDDTSNLKDWSEFDYVKTRAQKECRELSARLHDDDQTPDEETLDAHIVDAQPLIEAVMQCSNWWPDIEKRIQGRRDVLRQRDAEGISPEQAMQAG